MALHDLDGARSVNLSANDVHPAAKKLMTDAARLMTMK